MFIAYASRRHPTYGSLMVRCLVYTMYKHACHRDMEEIFKIVSVFHKSSFSWSWLTNIDCTSGTGIAQVWHRSSTGVEQVQIDETAPSSGSLDI